MVINSQYLKLDMGLEIKQVFDEQGAVQLQDFFDATFFAQLQDLAKQHSFERVKDPLEFSFEIAQCNQELQDLLLNDEILEHLGQLLEGEAQHITPLIIQAKHKDYALMQTPLLQRGLYHIAIGLDQWDESWGGNLMYHDGEGAATCIPPYKNSLALINKKDIHTYLQYVNNHAKENACTCILLIIE